MSQLLSIKNHKLNKNQILAIIVAIIIFIITILFTTATMIYRSGKIATTIKFAPYKATVTLNDTVVKNNSTAYLEPGEYHVVVSFEHFDNYEQDFVVSESTHDIFGILNANDDEGRDYANKYRNQFATVEGYIGKVLNEQGEQLQKQYPITKHLPIVNSLYSITYTRKNPDSEPIITLKATDDDLDVAVDRLKSFEDVNIIDLDLHFYTEFSTEFSTSNSTDPLTFAQESIPVAEKYRFSQPIELTDEYILIKIHAYNPNYGRAANYGYYRVILRRTDDGLERATDVKPLFTRRNTQNIPDDILKLANNK